MAVEWTLDQFKEICDTIFSRGYEAAEFINLDLDSANKRESMANSLGYVTKVKGPSLADYDPVRGSPVYTVLIRRAN